tara:strand:+ start:132 stop:722 length:591 start_codon:yes stop_codon:yes gene_type:complete
MSNITKPHDRQPGLIQTILDGIVWVSQLAAWLVILIIAIVLLSVLVSILDIGKIVEWESDVILFGERLTGASLGDLQWHIFGLMLMLTMAGALITDSHVRVDFFRQSMSRRKKRLVDIFGHLFFLIPFCYVAVVHGWAFTARALRLDEGSDYDGLYDRFLIKGTIPLGFALLLIAAVLLVIQNIQQLRTPDDKERN